MTAAGTTVNDEMKCRQGREQDYVKEGIDTARLEAYKYGVNGVQMNLKLEVPERAPEDERLKAVMDIVVERFGGNLMAYYEAIRPKHRELTEEEERMSLLATQLAKRL